MKFEIDNNKIIEEIKNGNQSVIPHLYLSYRQEFIKWAQYRYSTSEEDAKDIFQEVLVSFYISVFDGKLTVLTSDIKTYLFACGKNLLLNLIKKKSRNVPLTDMTKVKIKDEIAEQEKKTYAQDLIQQALSQLTEKCRQVISLYHISDYDMNSIALELNYKNSNVAKKKKSECMKKLAAIVKQIQEQNNI
jgi:RNA polymerase sigma factor (sigma-70 family)